MTRTDRLCQRLKICEYFNTVRSHISQTAFVQANGEVRRPANRAGSKLVVFQKEKEKGHVTRLHDTNARTENSRRTSARRGAGGGAKAARYEAPRGYQGMKGTGLERRLLAADDACEGDDEEARDGRREWSWRLQRQRQNDQKHCHAQRGRRTTREKNSQVAFRAVGAPAQMVLEVPARRTLALLQYVLRYEVLSCWRVRRKAGLGPLEARGVGVIGHRCGYTISRSREWQRIPLMRIMDAKGITRYQLGHGNCGEERGRIE
jgi:hypothetical protein